MKYTKPAITLIAAAKSAIQGNPKAGGPPDMEPAFVTTNAYEADE